MTGSGPGGPGESINWEEEADRLASRALAAGDATSWFEQLYAAGASGRVPVPWGRRDPHPLFVDWALRRAVRGEGRRAVVVGCGLGADADYTARLGFDTTGFDISATAIRLAGQRFPHTMVHYQVADLLALSAAWRHAFGLVVEIITVQALPDLARRQAIKNVASLVATEGTLLVLAAAHHPDMPESPVPPWPLRQNEIDAFATDDLIPVRVELLPAPGRPAKKAGGQSSIGQHPAPDDARSAFVGTPISAVNAEPTTSLRRYKLDLTLNHVVERWVYIGGWRWVLHRFKSPAMWSGRGISILCTPRSASASGI